jgi:hypothetical protein
VAPPSLDQHLGFGEAVEDLAVEQLVAERPVEALIVAILPRRSRCDVERLHADLREPELHSGGNELGTIVRPYVRWRSPGDEQIGQSRQDILMLELTRHDERQAFPTGLVDDGEDPELAPIMRAPSTKS